MSDEYEPDSPILSEDTPLLSGSTTTLTGGAVSYTHLTLPTSELV